MTAEREFMPMEEAAPHIAKVLQPILQQYRSAPREVQGYYANMLKWAIRDLERFVRPAVSKAALERATQKGIGDPRNYIWNEQTKKMDDPKRETFHWEHVHPVKDLTDELLNCDAADIGAIIRIISKAKIAWILKSENKGLKRSGRGDDPMIHYHKRDIVLLLP